MIEPLQITLAAARVNAGLTQQEIADKLGVNKKTVVGWEKGKNTPRFPYLFTMASIYHVPLDNIILPSNAPKSEPKEEDDVHSTV